MIHGANCKGPNEANVPSQATLKIACFNARSINNKTTGFLEVLKDRSVDICCTTETWLKLNDTAISSEIKDFGYDILSAPRAGRAGGVAFIFKSSKIKPTKNNVKHYTSFEALECVIKSKDGLLRICVIYRTTQNKLKILYEETKTSKFFDQFDEYLDDVLQKGGKPIICGDFNFHVEDKLDLVAQKFLSLIKSKGFHQHINKPTHIGGGTLDLLLTRKNVADNITIQNINIEPTTGMPTCDHYFIDFCIPFQIDHLGKSNIIEKDYRTYSKIDLETFRADIKDSPLCNINHYESMTTDDVVNIFNLTLLEILDKHAPLIAGKVNSNRSQWWNSTCKDRRSTRRRCERLFLKERARDPESECTKMYRTQYNDACVDAAITIEKERNCYYHKKLDSVSGNPRETFKVVSHLLDKEFGTSAVPNGSNDQEIAENMKDFFHEKVNKIYNEIGAANSGLKNHRPFNTLKSTSNISTFQQVTSNDVFEIVNSMPNKTCCLDPIPIWLLKACLPELIDIITFIVNKSLTLGFFPTDLKSASVRPTLKKQNLDSDDKSNYRPVSNLSSLSKLIEKCVQTQLVKYLNDEQLFSEFQSGYRKNHSCESAVIKIHNDIMMMIDKKTNVLLLLLDLSAAFDTINHKLLLVKLKKFYGISGIVLQWIESYLSGRSFTVSIGKSKSSTCVLEIGVPQGSILGPLLFILYTKDLESIVHKYGLSIHLYADDTQIYFSIEIDPESEDPDLSNIESCFNEIKSWMVKNFLKLNDDKTEVLEIGIYENCLSSVNLANIKVHPKDKAKNLGFKFDDQLSLQHHLNYVSQICNMNIRNYYKIASKLSFKLKVQLIHAGVLSVIDYCNGIYGGLSEADLNKLQKLQNSAVRFIFGIKLCDHKHISPYLKQLHFLPVRYRILYKLGLLVFKCLNNVAPQYLVKLISVRDPNNHSLRLDDDYFIINKPPAPNLKRTEAAFCLSGPSAWNSLPFNIRCQSSLDKFKTMLKTHYFNKAFLDV